MKKYLIGVPVLFLAAAGVAVVLFARQNGITPAYVTHGPGVATGIGAKLLCSAEYVMNSDREQAFADVVQYTPLLAELDVDYDDTAKSVTAAFWGMSESTATFVPGLGCAIDYPGYNQRRDIATRDTAKSTQPWPAGSTVETINDKVQATVTAPVAADNDVGLDTRALLVVHRGQIVAEAYGPNTSADSRLLGWSMAKSLTAVMLGNLEMRGLIDLSAPPGFASWASDDRAAIRIDHLLTMTDGLDFSEQYQPGDRATSMLFTEPSSAGFAVTSEALHSPGKVFNYSSGTANLLAQLHQDTLGSPQKAYDDFQTHIVEALGIQNGIFEMDAAGTFVGSSYFYAPARDWARLGQLMLNGGTLNGNRVVTAGWVKRATQPNTSGNEPAYGYQWWLNDGNEYMRFPDLPADAFFANGNRQQTVMVLPSQDTVIVRLGWTSGRYPVNDNFRKILSTLGD